MSDRSSDVRPSEQVSTVQRSLGDLFGELSQEFSNLIHQELQLAKAELRDDAAGRRRTDHLLLGAGLAAALCIAFVGAGIAWGLAEVIHVGWAFFLVGVAFGVGAVLLYQRSNVTEVAPGPTGPIEGDRF